MMSLPLSLIGKIRLARLRADTGRPCATPGAWQPSVATARTAPSRVASRRRAAVRAEIVRTESLSGGAPWE